jgi:hypothetical protein
MGRYMGEYMAYSEGSIGSGDGNSTDLRLSWAGEKPMDEKPAKTELDEVLDTLADVLAQSCGLPDGRLDSMALRAYAEGIRLLHRYKRVVIEDERGRRVIGRFVEHIH